MQRAATKARRTAGANIAWPPLRRFIEEDGKFRLSRQRAQQFIIFVDKTAGFPVRCSNATSVIAASAQASAPIRRSSAIVFAICRSKGPARRCRFLPPCEIGAVITGAECNSRSSKSRLGDCDAGARMTGSHKRAPFTPQLSIGDEGHKKARSKAASEYVNFRRSLPDKQATPSRGGRGVPGR